MTTSSVLQPPNVPSYPSLRLDTIPAEIRAIIYTHVQNPLYLVVNWEGRLIMKAYPWQLSAVSHLIRDEYLPSLLGRSTLQPLHLLCVGGRFPDSVRRRIPNRVLDGISTIVIIGTVQYDELKPSVTTFPNLRELWLHSLNLTAPSTFNNARLGSTVQLPLSDETMNELIHDVKIQKILPTAENLKREQEMPKEGLERDYYVDGTLYEVLEMKPERRGFEVKVLIYLHVRGVLFGELMIDSWDIETGALKRLSALPWEWDSVHFYP